VIANPSLLNDILSRLKTCEDMYGVQHCDHDFFYSDGHQIGNITFVAFLIFFTIIMR